MSLLEGRGVASTQNDVELVAQRPLRLGGGQVKVGDQTLPRLFVAYGLKDRVESKQGIAGEVHLRNQARGKGRPKQRKMYVRRTPGVVMVLPRIRAGLDGHKTIAAVFVRKRAARAAEVGIKRRRMMIAIMAITDSGIGLPDLKQRVRHGASVVIQHAPGDDDPLSYRFSVVL